MHLDPIIPYLVSAILAVLILGLFLRSLRQPYVIGYLIAGIILGPHGYALIIDSELLSRPDAIVVVSLSFLFHYFAVHRGLCL